MSRANALTDLELGNHDRGRSEIGPVRVRAKENLWGVPGESDCAAKGAGLSDVEDRPLSKTEVSNSKSLSKLGMSKEGRVGKLLSLRARRCPDDGLCAESSQDSQGKSSDVDCERDKSEDEGCV